MGEQELAAFMGAEFIMGTAMDDQRLQPVQRGQGPTATGKARPLARRRVRHAPSTARDTVDGLNDDDRGAGRQARRVRGVARHKPSSRP